MTALMEYGLLMVGLAIGGMVGWLVAKQSLAGQLIRAEERLRANEASVNERGLRYAFWSAIWVGIALSLRDQRLPSRAAKSRFGHTKRPLG